MTGSGGYEVIVAPNTTVTAKARTKKARILRWISIRPKMLSTLASAIGIYIFLGVRRIGIPRYPLLSYRSLDKPRGF